MKKIIRIILLIVVAALAFAAVSCTSEYVDPELPDDYVVNPQGKVKVSMYLRSGEESQIALDQWIHVYNQMYPNVTVRKDVIAWSQFPIQVAAGDIGDVYYSACGDVYNYAVKYKAAMPLDSYIDNLDINIKDIYSGVYDLCCCDGHLVMVPSDITQETFQVNVSLLRECGLEVPKNDWTWDDLINTYCKTISRQAQDGTSEKVCLYYGDGGEVVTLIYFMTGWGGKWVDSVNKQVHFSSDERVLEGITQYINLIKNGYASVYGLKGEYAVKYGNLQYPQDCAFQPQLLWQSRVVYQSASETLGLDYDVVCPPKTPTRVTPGDTFGYIVYSKTSNPDAAATLALSLMSYEGQEAFNSVIGGGIPVRQDVVDLGEWKLPYDESEFNYDAYVAYPESFVACWTECYLPPAVSEIAKEALNTMSIRHFANEQDYTDILKEAEQQCNEKWATIFD